VDVFDVFTRPVPPEPVREPCPGYTFRWGTAEDLDRCTPHHTELDAHERRTGTLRLGLEHRVVIAFAGDEPVFSMWVNPRNLNVPGLIKRRLEPHQWFIYKAFTSPDHRGRKLYKLGMQFVLDAMCEEGLTELVGYAHVKKRVSRLGLARLSFGAVGRMVHVAFPGWRHTFVSSTLARRFPREVPRSGVIEELLEAKALPSV
jgi:hypothetical protein